MNKIFKVIWNHATQSWVATSELSRSKGKTKSKSLSTAKSALAAAIAVAATSGSAYAATAIGSNGYTTTGTSVSGSGKGGTATSGSTVAAVGGNWRNSALVIGENASSMNANAVVIGTNASATMHQSVNTNNQGLVVIGTDALVRNVSKGASKGSVAIGSNSLSGLLTDAGAAEGSAISLTNADYATNSGNLDPARLMYRAGITDATGALASSATNWSESNEATAIGFDSRAIGDQSIAIGAQVVAGHSSVAIGGNDYGTIYNNADLKAKYKAVVGSDIAGNTENINGSWYETTYAKDGSVAIGLKAHSNELFGTAIGSAAFVQAGADLGTAIGAGARVGNQTKAAGDSLSSTSITSTKGGVAVAAGAVAEGDFTTAVGTGSNALAVNATALGYKALANKTNATAVGAAAIAAADNALAYGANATSYGENAVAIGTNATVTSTGVSSVAFGSNTNVSGARSVALGNNITNLTTAGSVVLGDSSVQVTGKGKENGAPEAVETVKEVVIGEGIATLTYSGFAGQVQDAGQYLSIGSVGAERQIKNVAPGAITNVSTDAINGSQLYAALNVLGDQVGQIYFHTNNGSNTGTGNATTNLGYITDAAGAQGLYATTAGVNSTSSSDYGIAYGYNSTAKGQNAADTGGGAIALGSNTLAYDGSIAVGINTTVIGSDKTGAIGAVAIGRNTTIDVTDGSASASIAIGNGTYASGSRTGYATAHNGERVALGVSTAVGDHAYADIGSTAFGQIANATGQNATAIGHVTTAAGDWSTAVGYQSKALTTYDLAMGYNNTADATQYSIWDPNKDNGKDEDGNPKPKGGWNEDRGRAIAIGVESTAKHKQALAVGIQANALGQASISMGNNSIASGGMSIAMGQQSRAESANSTALGFGAVTADTAATAVGTSARALGNSAFAASRLSRAHGDNSVAVGHRAYALGTNSTANGHWSLAATTGSIALGTNATSGATQADTNVLSDAQGRLALEYIGNRNAANITALQATIAAEEAKLAAMAQDTIAIGTRAFALGNQSISIGAGSNVTGTQSIAVGVGHVVEANNAGAFGDPNYIRAGADRSYATGNNNTITTADTFVLGSNVNRNADGTDNAVGTVANSVYLGNDSEATAGEKVGTAVLDKDQKAGKTTTAGNNGTVTDATVAGVTYGGFAGDKANGVVTVGAAGDERRIQNVAAGEISETSTDAINGSQLYAVYKQAAKPLTIKANTNNDTDAELLDTQYAEKDGTQLQLGNTLNIIGAATAAADIARDTAAPTAGTYSAKNVQTVVSNNEVQIQIAEKPEFKEITVKADDTDTNPVVISSGAGDTGGTISNLTSTLPDVVTTNTTDKDGNPVNYTTNIARPEVPATSLTNAATLGDVLNAGWNLQTNTKALDFVKPYDTVNFVDGNGTTIVSKSDGNISTIQVDVNVSSLVGDVTTNPNGTTSIGDNNDGNKLANISTVVDAINKSGFTLTSNATTGGVKDSASTGEEMINPGDVIEMIAGKNMTVKQEANGKITYSTKDSVEFSNANVTSSLPSTSLNVGEEGDKKPSELLDLTNATTNTPNAVVTAKDLAKYGWIVATPNNNYDAAVKNANYVNFIGDGGVVVEGANNATTGKYDVVVKLEQAGAIKLETGNGTTVPTGKLEVKDNPTGFVTAQNVVDMVNNSGWNTNSTTATGGAENTLVKPGAQVNFEAGKNMEVTQTVDNGNVTYTYATKDDVTFNSTTVGGNEITYTGKDGNPVTKNEAGDFVDAAGNVVNPDNVTTKVDNPITIGTVDGKNVISNLTSTLPNTTSVGDKPTEKAPITAEDAQNIANTAGNNAATLGDVLNAGWNLKVNNEDVDFVKPYDTVAFVNGTGTTARVEYKDGVQSNITFDVNVDNKTTEITYADAAGNQVVKVGDKFYNPADLNEDGTPKAGAKPVENVVSRISAIGPKVNGETVSGPINIVNGDTTTVTNTPDGVKVEVNTGASDVTDEGKATVTYTDKNGNPVTATTNPDGSVTYTDKDGKPVAAGDVVSSGDKVATVGDIVNTINNVGWFTNSTTSTEPGTNTKISAGKAVNFEAGLNMEVKQDVDKTGNVTYTYATKKEVTFDKVTADKGITLGAGDNAVNMTPTTTNVANGDISPAVNMNGATFTNMTSNLPNTTSVGDNPTTKAPLTAQEAQDLANKSGSNAATLGDVLNAGWNLQENGKEKDFVKPYDTVNFVNGVGTTANITTDGSVSNVTYNVNVDNQTTEITYTNKAGDTIYKLADGTYNTSADGKGTAVAAGDISGSQVSAKTSPLTNNVDGTVNTPANPKSLATAGDVANAINNSGFTLTTSASAGEVSGTSKELVKPGKTVTIDAGKNIKVTQKGGVVSVATKDDVEFNSVQLGQNGTGPKLSADGDNVKVANSKGEPTKITNVAPGTEPNDAVNVSQLKQVAGDIHNKINRNNKDLRAGIAGANAAAGLPQVYIPGKSMVAASAGTFKGQSAVAVGYSRASDNGKLILKLQGNANTRGDIGGSVGVGYQW